MDLYQPQSLVDRGLILPAPQAVYVDVDVCLDRLAPGATLYPGTRMSGPKTVLAANSSVGSQGPTHLKNVALGRGASVASGTVEEACLLDGASLGPNSHVRVGTLLEESSSTGHAVGLKQTILLSFATLGSQINFCDCLMAGGTSRNDHSEVGSGFIHFNFTPFGERGDKATASLFGDVCQGVFLNKPRIFLGGSGGVVGPARMGYGTTLAAGSVYRRDYESGLLVYGETTLAKSRAFDPLLVARVGQRTRKCLAYIGELRALYAWYRDVRLFRETDPLNQLILEMALDQIESAIAERSKQIQRFLDGAHGAHDESSRDIEETRTLWQTLSPDFARPPEVGEEVLLRNTFLEGVAQGRDHVSWVQGLDEEKVEQGRTWLRAISQPGSFPIL